MMTGKTMPTLDDVAAFAELQSAARRLGPERMAIEVLQWGYGLYPVLAFLAAQEIGIDEVLDTLRLDPGDLGEIVSTANGDDPAETLVPLPPGERTTFPPDDDDDVPFDPPTRGYAGRRHLTVIDVPSPVAAGLATMVPGVKGLVLFAAARGDAIREIAAMLKITTDEVDAVLEEGDGEHLICSR